MSGGRCRCGGGSSRLRASSGSGCHRFGCGSSGGGSGSSGRGLSGRRGRRGRSSRRDCRRRSRRHGGECRRNKVDKNVVLCTISEAPRLVVARSVVVALPLDVAWRVVEVDWTLGSKSGSAEASGLLIGRAKGGVDRSSDRLGISW